jgi:hypothetical protein
LAEDKYSEPKDGKTFWDDPIEYCKGLYHEYEKHNNAMRSEVEEDRKFYELYDELLEDRKKNSNVVRSSAFIPELRPAIDSALSRIMDAVLEQENPIKVSRAFDSQDDPNHVIRMEEKINEELRQIGVLTLKFKESLDGAAIMPLVFAKMGWENKEGWQYRKTTLMERVGGNLKYMLRIAPSPPPDVTKEWALLYSRPYVEICDFDEILYDPTAGTVDECEALIHRKWVSWHDFVNIVIENDYDDSDLDKIRDGLAKDTDTAKGSGDTIVGAVASDLEERAIGYKDGKVLVCEYWIPVHDRDGREEVRVFAMAANQYRLSRVKHGIRSPWDKFKYPFIVLCFNKQYKRLEGTSWVKMGKELQRVYNDNINAYLDYMTYNMFPVIKRAPGTVMAKKPVFGPGAVWDVTNPDGLEVLHIPAGDVATVLPFSSMIAAGIRQNINAPDIAQGIEGQPSESKVKTGLREQGTQMRSRVPAKNAGDFLTEMAQKAIYMHQTMGDDDWIMNVRIDVPSLTGAKSPEDEREEAVFLLTSAIENPVYQTPSGIQKLRNLTERMYQKFRMRDINKILPSEEEIGLVNPMGKMVEDAAEQEKAIKNENEKPDVKPADIIPIGGQQEETQNAV